MRKQLLEPGDADVGNEKDASALMSHYKMHTREIAYPDHAQV